MAGITDSTDSALPFGTRIWFAWACFFRVLFDGRFAQRVWNARDTTPQLAPPKITAAPALPAPTTSALQLLSLLQREGRLIDFLEQDIVSFPDAEIGAAVRVVHEGCRKTIRSHAKIAPVRSENEETRITVAAGFNPAEIKLIGNVQGKGPYAGVLKHKGWKVTQFELPTPLPGHDANVLAPAEIEL